MQAKNENLPGQDEEHESSNDNDQARVREDQDDNTTERIKARDALKAISPPVGRRRRHHYSEDDLSLRFTSCGRCSLFLTTYRLGHNQEFLLAIEDIEADWLILPWHPDMREIVNKSFGVRVDIQSYFLEGTCPECLRSFSYAEPDPDQTAWFLVKL